ncbi:MAG: extracellular solute-binding protein [Candidatus Hydrogenedentes bacterium]|nr:extracellular solute-binding protein [Candidatus Hydrogenedentota bacterium]
MCSTTIPGTRREQKGSTRLANAIAVCAIVLLAGCGAPPQTVDPHAALSAASARIDAVLAASRAEARPAGELPPMPSGAATLRFWYYAHPLIGRAVSDQAAAIPGVTVEAQYIGEWNVAIQKLMASFVVDDLPDVGMVKRDLVAKLYESGRIRPLDAILPAALLADFREEVIADYTYDGHLIALPADGFCSVLYYTKTSVGTTPPKNWSMLNAFVNAHNANPGPRPPRGMGAFPYMEALWSADGNVLLDGTSGLSRPEAQRAFDFVLEVSTTEDAAFQRWLAGGLGMTVASSSHLPAAARSGLDYGVVPVPGETGPIARRSNDAVVVFVCDEGADGAAITKFLDWLTGPEVMGEAATSQGSVPIRKSLLSIESKLPEIAAAYQAGKNTPLHPAWGAIESELERGLAEARQAVASG